MYLPVWDKNEYTRLQGPPAVPQGKYCTFCATPASYDTPQDEARILAIGLNKINISRYNFASHAQADVLTEDDGTPL